MSDMSLCTVCGHFPWWRHQMETFFRVTGHMCGDFTGHRWIPLTNASDAELWCFIWSAPDTSGWANNRDAGDLRCHCTHYDVIVMFGNSFSGLCHFMAHVAPKSIPVWQFIEEVAVCFMAEFAIQINSNFACIVQLPQSSNWLFPKLTCSRLYVHYFHLKLWDPIAHQRFQQCIT